MKRQQFSLVCALIAQTCQKLLRRNYRLEMVTVQASRTVTAYGHAKSLRDGHMPAKFTFSYGLRSECAGLCDCYD